MIDRLRAHLLSAQLFPEPGLALLAVSGGPDSVALVHLLHALAPEFGLTLAIGHVDHGIHPDSGAWTDHVRHLGGARAVPVHVATLALGTGTAETAARSARYQALDTQMAETGARYLVTAHHADDQIETILFRVLRGSAPAGLAGMAPVRGWLVRPLLPFRRAELAPWAAKAVRDPANDDPGHDRSWIRGALLPTLRGRFGDRVEDHILALGAHAAEDRRAWEQVAALVPGLRAEIEEGQVRCSRKAVAALPAPLAGAVLRALAFQAGLMLRPQHAARLAGFVERPEGGRRLELGGGLEAETRSDTLTMRVVSPRSGVPASP